MFSWNVWPISMGWPVVVMSAQARPILRQKFFMAVSRMAYVRCGDGHAQGALKGVSPQPEAVLPSRSSTSMRTLTQVTLSSCSVPKR